MAKKSRKQKDLDPKSRAGKVRGGNLPDDQKNINRSVGQITKSVQTTAKSVGPAIQRAVHNPGR